MSPTDNILQWMKEQSENKEPIDPFLWLQAAEKLNALIGDENDLLIELQQKVASRKVELLDGGLNASITKMRVEAMQENVECQKQRAKIAQIQEAIRLAKLHSRLKSEELRSNL